jgi:hypothetical protein
MNVALTVKDIAEANLVGTSTIKCQHCQSTLALIHLAEFEPTPLLHCVPCFQRMLFRKQTPPVVKNMESGMLSVQFMQVYSTLSTQIGLSKETCECGENFAIVQTSAIVDKMKKQVQFLHCDHTVSARKKY